MTRKIRSGESYEFRAYMNSDVIQAADVFAQKVKMTLPQWVEALIAKEVKVHMDELNVTNRMLEGNPMLERSFRNDD